MLEFEYYISTRVVFGRDALTHLEALIRKYSNAFIGNLGDDFLGHMLADTVQAEGIHTEGLCFHSEVHTALAPVHTKPDGGRDFSFYRSPGADMMLTEDDIPPAPLANTRILHFVLLSMTDDGVFAATKKAVALAEKHRVFRSFDPDLRPPLWKSLAAAKERIRCGLAHCDLLRISANELQ